MRDAFKLVAYALLTAAFIWGFYVGQQQLAFLNFKNGVEAGLQYCNRPGGTLPNSGEIKVLNLEPGSTEAIRN